MCKKLFKLFRICVIGYLSPGECPDCPAFLLKNLYLTPSEHTKYDEYNDLLHEQSLIGWDNLLRGKFSKNEEYFKDAMNADNLIKRQHEKIHMTNQ